MSLSLGTITKRTRLHQQITNCLIPSITSPQSEADPAVIWERSVGPHQEMLYKDKARFVWKMLNVLRARQPRNCLQEMMRNLPRHGGWAMSSTTCQGKGSSHHRPHSKCKCACTQKERNLLPLLSWVHVPTLRKEEKVIGFLGSLTKPSFILYFTLLFLSCLQPTTKICLH